jgi:hypothetical protein
MPQEPEPAGLCDCCHQPIPVGEKANRYPVGDAGVWEICEPCREAVIRIKDYVDWRIGIK